MQPLMRPRRPCPMSQNVLRLNTARWNAGASVAGSLVWTSVLFHTCTCHRAKQGGTRQTPSRSRFVRGHRRRRINGRELRSTRLHTFQILFESFARRNFCTEPELSTSRDILDVATQQPGWAAHQRDCAIHPPSATRPALDRLYTTHHHSVRYYFTTCAIIQTHTVYWTSGTSSPASDRVGLGNILRSRPARATGAAPLHFRGPLDWALPSSNGRRGRTPSTSSLLPCGRSFTFSHAAYLAPDHSAHRGACALPARRLPPPLGLDASSAFAHRQHHCFRGAAQPHRCRAVAAQASAGPDAL